MEMFMITKVVAVVVLAQDQHRRVHMRPVKLMYLVKLTNRLIVKLHSISVGMVKLYQMLVDVLIKQ